MAGDPLVRSAPASRWSTRWVSARFPRTFRHILWEDDRLGLEGWAVLGL
jgi:hypothetical protein